MDVMVTDEHIFTPSLRGDGLLSEEECRALLATRTLGRIALTSGALPVIMPVEYVYADGVITFRSERDTSLRAAAEGDVLAFEIDFYDPHERAGWSVLVLGRATVLTSDHEVSQLPLFDGSDGEPGHHHYVRLHVELISGRRYVPRLG